MKTIDAYCKNQTLENFLVIKPPHRDIFFTESKKCVKNGTGKIDIAENVIKHYKLGNLSEKQINGIKAVVKALRSLEAGDNQYGFPLLRLYSKKDLIYEITYNQDKKLPNMYQVIIENDILNRDQDLMLYFENLKGMLIDHAYTHRIEIDKIVYYQPHRKKVFWDKKDGFIINDNNFKWISTL